MLGFLGRVRVRLGRRSLLASTGGAALGVRRQRAAVEPLEKRQLLAATVLNELEVNTPGPHGPYEYVELKGDPGAVLNDLYLVAVEGDADPEAFEPNGPGGAELVVSLTGQSIGASGLLVVTATIGGHPVPAGTTHVTTTLLDSAGTALENGSNSYLLVSSPTPIVLGADYDVNDDGVLELPAGAVITDAVGWFDHRLTDVNAANDKVYGGVALKQSTDSPDAATRFPGNNTPSSFAAWYNGELLTGAAVPPDDVDYDTTKTSLNFPSGGMLTPGAANVPDVILPPPRLNELRVNPVGTDVVTLPDGTRRTYEYVELKGAPNQTLTRLFFVSMDGDAGSTGVPRLVMNLSGKTLGPNGLLVLRAPLAGTGEGVTVPAGTAVDERPGFTLENDTNSFLLIASLDAIRETSALTPADYDGNDDGVLDLPPDALVVDSVGWSDGGAGDRVYGGVLLTQSGAAPAVPDAATRFPNNDTFLSAAAWYNGDLDTSGASGTTGAVVQYSSTNRSANFPTGGVLTPGDANLPTAPNQPPQNSAPTSASSTEDQALVFSAGGAYPISVGDPDATINRVQVTLTATHGALMLSGTAGLVVTAGANNTASLTVQGTLADLNAALNGLTFVPAANYGGPASLTITTDDLGNSGSGGPMIDTDVVALSVVPVGDVPTLTVGSAAGAANTAIGLSVAAGLVDDDGSEALSVRIDNVPAGATLSAGTDNGGGTWVLTPPQLAGLTLSGPARGTYTLLVTATATEGANGDSAQTAEPLALQIVEPPTNTAPASASTAEDQALVFSAAGANPVSVSDPDAGPNPVQITLTATHGTLTLSGTAGLTFTAGANGTASLTVRGTVSDLNAALNGLAFAPVANYSGPASLTIATDDLGSNGVAGPLTDTDVVAVSVLAVADAPTLVVGGATGNAGAPIGLSLAAGLVDDDGSETLSVRIDGVPAGATLSAGTDQGGGTWQLAPAQLAGLTVIVPSGGTYVLNVTATATEAANGSTAQTSASLNLQVASTSQLLVDSFAGPGSGLRERPLQFAAHFTDTDVAAHTAVIDWGDGTSSPATVTESGGAGTAVASHVYSGVGAFTASVTVTGATGSASSSAVVNVVDHLVAPDPFEPGNWVLTVVGTPAADQVLLTLGSAATPGAYVLTITDSRGTVQYSEDAGVPVSRVEVYALNGDDGVEVDSGGRSVPAWLFGGGGNDGLNAASGSDALFGGDGDDNLKGGGGASGNDWLVGGLGRDKLDGGRGEDILIGGYTAYDDNLAAISSLMKRWAGSGVFAARVALMRDGTTYPFALRATTVFDDGTTGPGRRGGDTLKGGDGLDWLVGGAGDVLSDLTAGEISGV